MRTEIKTITLVVEGGVIQDILGIPPGVRIVVRDYDVDDDCDNLDFSYVENEWKALP